MDLMSKEWLDAFWSFSELRANLVIFCNIFGALLLGLLVGYERSYHGRAAGMRTYGMVCMASAALTVFVGYPEYWFAGHGQHAASIDPTRVVQGIVTGIGFLGAGVIMKEGLNISGLTTAASIWASSAIGVLVGIGFYGAAISLTLLSSSLMLWGATLEARLPSRHAIGVNLHFAAGRQPSQAQVAELLLQSGYVLAEKSIAIGVRDQQFEWNFVAVAVNRDSGASLPALANALQTHTDIERFQLSHARN
ncbi:MgtC/SapB family protein [Curvibacter gracilis]|uniref:MgtC/SapB family protein n=1 Tax=Curvibacter gracilis TaxID=230310 RepID=UPI000485DC28|nr:MgtC/SapB family protein [Curvibacter gracilis]